MLLDARYLPHDIQNEPVITRCRVGVTAPINYILLMHVFVSQEDVDDMCLVNHVVVTLRHDEFLFNLWSLLALWWQRLPPHGNNV